MSMSMPNFADIGSAASSIFGAMGDQAEAAEYKQAANLAEQNVAFEQESTNIQTTQANRQIYQTLGAQTTAIAGAGLANSGSAQDLYRSSVQQGNLQKQVIQIQGGIQENAYREAADAYRAQEGAANSAAMAGFLGGAGQLAGGLGGSASSLLGSLGGSDPQGLGAASDAIEAMTV